MSTKRNSDPHYLDCIDPKCKGEFESFGIDISKNPVYRCDACGKKIGESGLNAAARERRMKD